MCVAFVNEFSDDVEQLALDCVYDKNLYDKHSDHMLVYAAFVDNEVQNYLHVLAKCEWDTTWASLVWDHK
jgi:hypothetical protein